MAQRKGLSPNQGHSPTFKKTPTAGRSPASHPAAKPLPPTAIWSRLAAKPSPTATGHVRRRSRHRQPSGHIRRRSRHLQQPLVTSGGEAVTDSHWPHPAAKPYLQQPLVTSGGRAEPPTATGQIRRRGRYLQQPSGHIRRRSRHRQPSGPIRRQSRFVKATLDERLPRS